MSIEDLLRERRIHRHQADSAAIRALIERAGDDLASAAHMLEQDADWALSIAHNASCVQHGRLSSRAAFGRQAMRHTRIRSPSFAKSPERNSSNSSPTSIAFE